MFHWICPECGREIAPAMKECSFCDASSAAAPPPLPSPAEVVAVAVPIAGPPAVPLVTEVAEIALAPVREPVAEARVAPEREHKETHDPLRAAAEQLRNLQAQAHANALANGVNSKAEAKAKREAEAKLEAEAKAEAAAKAEAEARQTAQAKLDAEAKAEAEAHRAKLETEARAEAEARHAAEAKREADARAEAEARQAAEAKREAEAKAEAEVLQAAEAKREAEAKAEAEALQAAEAKRVADAKAEAEALQAAEAKRVADVAAEAEARRAAEAKQVADAKSEEEARQAAEAKRVADATAEAEAWLAAELKREAEAKAEVEARRAGKAKLDAEAKAVAEARRAKLEADAKAEAEARQAAEAKRQAEEKAEELARQAAEAKAEADARQAAQAKLEAERKAAEEQARAEAEAKAVAEAKLEAEAKQAEEAKAQADAQAQIEAQVQAEKKTEGEPTVEIKPRLSPPALPGEPVVPPLALPVESSESMVRDLAALASINEPGVAPEHVEAPQEESASTEQVVPVGLTSSGAGVEPSTTPLGPLQMGLLQASPTPVALLAAPEVALPEPALPEPAALGLAAPELEARTQVQETVPVLDPLPQVPGLAAPVEVPAMKPVPVTRPAVFAEPVAELPERTPALASELTATVAQQTLPPPSFSLASREGHPSSVASRMKPRTSRPKVAVPESAPQFHLPGPSIPPQLESVSEAGLTAAAIGKMAFRSPKKPAGAPGKGAVSSAKGWLVSLSVMTVMLAVGGGVIYWAIPAQTLASVRGPAAKTEPATPAPDQPIPETPQTPTNSLSKQIEVTGFRFITQASKKPEIHYLVVNHSALALNDVTVFVTLHAGNAKPGQPPLSRFSFRAPNVPAYESKEMSSTIEKISQPMALPDWQDVKVEVTIGQ